MQSKKTAPKTTKQTTTPACWVYKRKKKKSINFTTKGKNTQREVASGLGLETGSLLKCSKSKKEQTAAMPQGESARETQPPERWQRVWGTSDPSAIATSSRGHRRAGSPGIARDGRAAGGSSAGPRNGNRLLPPRVCTGRTRLNNSGCSLIPNEGQESEQATRICGVDNNVEIRKRCPTRYSYQKRKQ